MITAVVWCSNGCISRGYCNPHQSNPLKTAGCEGMMIIQGICLLAGQPHWVTRLHCVRAAASLCKLRSGSFWDFRFEHPPVALRSLSVRKWQWQSQFFSSRICLEEPLGVKVCRVARRVAGVAGVAGVTLVDAAVSTLPSPRPEPYWTQSRDLSSRYSHAALLLCRPAPQWTASRPALQWIFPVSRHGRNQGGSVIPS